MDPRYIESYYKEFDDPFIIVKGSLDEVGVPVFAVFSTSLIQTPLETTLFSFNLLFGIVIGLDGTFVLCSNRYFQVLQQRLLCFF